MNLRRVFDILGYVAFSLVVIYLVLSIVGLVKIPWASVGGFSMEPTLETGTLVFLCPLPKNATELLGSIVVYDHVDEYIIHRVINVYYSNGQYYIETKGDANMVPDPWQTPINQVYGVVCGAVQYLGLLTLILKKPFTLMLGIVTVVVLWVILEVIENKG